MVESLNIMQQNVNSNYRQSTTSNTNYTLPMLIIPYKNGDSKIVENKYPGINMAVDTWEKITDESRLSAFRPPKTSSIQPVFNKTKNLITELLDKTRKIDTQDVAIEAGMQIKDWYDSHKVSSS